MANTHQKISNLINSQVPFFVRNDHQNFVKFLEKYYEWLEQQDNLLSQLKNIQNFQNVDLTEDEFAKKLYDQFLILIPEYVKADKNVLLKNIKDFYRARGTEKSIRFLMNLIYGISPEFYYPKKDILRASDGKWYEEKTLRITDTRISNISNNEISGLEKFRGIRIYGQKSNATALIENTNRFFEAGFQIDELILSNIKGEFTNGETVSGKFNDLTGEKIISSNIFSGILNAITISNPGSGYQVGSEVPIVSLSGANANVFISKVSAGQLDAINVFDGGAGFRANDIVLVLGGGTGFGALANVETVLLDNSIHPNSYNIVSSTINLEANTPINNVRYSNLKSSLVDPANSWVSNSMSYWVYANTGPARTIIVLNTGTNYSETPTLTISANATIAGLGILGRMKIVEGGVGYQENDIINIENIYGGYGVGAAGKVTQVDANGSIREVKFISVSGHPIGGSGYRQALLPTANVISANINAYGANVLVTAILGAGADLRAANTTIGAIEQMVIKRRGDSYQEEPYLDLTELGDGKAKANVSIVKGVYSYPGRFLNDDGQISSANYLEDRDYYQIYSYVILSNQSVEKYKDILYSLTHPAGGKLIGQFSYIGLTEQLDFLARDSLFSNSYTDIVTDNLMIHLDAANLTSYPAGSGGNTWYDLTANSRDFTLVNNPSFNIANSGSIVFDGVNDYAISKSNNSLYVNDLFANTNSSWTVSTWFKFPKNPTRLRDVLFNTGDCSYSIVGKSSGITSSATFIMYVGGSTPLYGSNKNKCTVVLRGANTTITSNTVNTGTWFNATVTWDGTTAYGYLNNSSAVLLNVGTAPLQPMALAIGSTANGSFYHTFEGSISDVKIYNRALSSSEITKNYKSIKHRYGL